MSDRTARRIFIASAALLGLTLVFFWGYSTRHSGAWPYGLIEDGRLIARSLRHYQRIVPVELMTPRPADSSDQRVTILQPDLMPPGWFVMLGWDAAGEHYAAWLLDAQGHQHHTWPIDYRALDPDGPLNGSDTPHGLLVFPDGSLLLNFDHGDVMARLDACGNAMWVRHGIFHHSFDLDDDGTVWTWSGSGTPYAHHHSLLRFDPATGETLEEHDLIGDILARNPELEIVLGTRTDFPFRHFDRTPNDPSVADLFHPNDVEVLNAADAAAFPGLAAGDLMISLRNRDLVAILDRQDLRLKWWSIGPWTMQHDPDFTADGWISVYDNNTGLGRSEIIRMDPRSREVTNPLRNGDVRFYSGTMGKHQILPGGLVLIVVPAEGRTLVATGDGDRVFEFNNVVPDLAHVNAHVSNGIWLEPGYFTEVPACADHQ